MKATILVHGGVGTPAEDDGGCKEAVQVGLEALKKGKDAGEAAVQATVVLENDERYNAGFGSNLRLDGKTVEMDAALMTSDGRMGSVAAVQKVKNPVLLAQAVWDSPHRMLCGQGAMKFAGKLGLDMTLEVAPRAKEKYERLKKKVKEKKLAEHPLWKDYSLEKFWNYDSGLKELFGATDTVGVVIWDGKDKFAAALSTGGAGTMMLGRVGDSPLPGCGFYVGPEGAVVATGLGEEIIRKMLSYEVYQAMVKKGKSPREACQWGVELYPEEIPIGLLAINREDYGAAHNWEMAWSEGSLE